MCFESGGVTDTKKQKDFTANSAPFQLAMLPNGACGSDILCDTKVVRSLLGRVGVEEVLQSFGVIFFWACPETHPIMESVKIEVSDAYLGCLS